ncbi:hypothetical protein HPP92_001473 [Vanilla planifolia]|uniref:Uncharacterized protein n=1 Tax=Vanilla planifolia TaxID=51239 RepID=A0A835S3E9_VANPL|nr:hypothetical protein HPP92_001473 [Vanilla planifolia]
MASTSLAGRTTVSFSLWETADGNTRTRMEKPGRSRRSILTYGASPWISSCHPETSTTTENMTRSRGKIRLPVSGRRPREPSRSDLQGLLR